MLTDDERKTINHAADVLGPSLRDLATRLRAIAAPRTAPSPTPDACAAIERAATWIELGDLGGTPDAVALVATLREFVRTPLVATVARCSCTHEAGDSRCAAHPTCSACGEQTARNVDDCADHTRGPVGEG